MLRNVGLFKTIAPILRRSDSPIFLIDVQMLVCFCAHARTFTSLPQYISAGAHAPQLTIPFWTAQIFTLDRFTILLLLGYITRRTSLCCCCSKVLIRIIGKLLVPLSWVLSLFLLQRICGWNLYCGRCSFEPMLSSATQWWRIHGKLDPSPD